MSSSTLAPSCAHAPEFLALEGIAMLSHLGVIRARGTDAASFLQGQLTQDVLTLPPGEGRLAAFCSAKGRMQASFWLVRPKSSHGATGASEAPPPMPEFWLICSRDILFTTLKRLSMFVLRAKVQLDDASGELAILGLAGESAIHSVASQAYSLALGAQFGEINTVKLPPAGIVQRALALLSGLGSGDTANASRAVVESLNQPALPLAIWSWGEVQSGVATITRPIVDAFVPQMLNYESVGAVNFKKGCYPGQEIVARSQFRGTLKRRAYIVQGDAAMTAGDEIFSASDPSQPCGTVAQAANSPGSANQTAIVSMQITAAESAAPLSFKSPEGPRLVLLPLPYILLNDI
jgi:tRNA-modifying protein YgfZ